MVIQVTYVLGYAAVVILVYVEIAHKIVLCLLGVLYKLKELCPGLWIVERTHRLGVRQLDGMYVIVGDREAVELDMRVIGHTEPGRRNPYPQMTAP